MLARRVALQVRANGSNTPRGWLIFAAFSILLSLVDRRHNHQATIIASQFEPAEWLDQIPVPVAAEAITDRLCSQAYKIVIKGKKSMRETVRA